MSSYHYGPPDASARVDCCATIFQHFFENGHLPLGGILTGEQVQKLLHQHGVDFANGENDIWTPMLTLWVLVIQYLSKDKSCAAAVASAMGFLWAHGRELCSSNTSGYCKARAKFPEAFLRDLAQHVGWTLEDRVESAWQLGGRRVFLVDGSTLTMPDTEKNQEKYPQQRGQKKGVGFPILRIVMVFSAATGALVAVAWGRYRGKQTGECALLRRVWDMFQADDVLLADGLYADYFTFLLARRKGLQLLFFAHHARLVDFKTGRRLGSRDHLATWEFPARPEWLDKKLYRELRQEAKECPLEIRELEVKVAQAGFRTKTLRLATTLVDAQTYSKTTLANWYRCRWNAELDIRNLKTTMQMEHLRCQFPEMVHVELWANFLAYNLIRKLICQAAWLSGVTPRSISFNFARQVFQTNTPYLVCFSRMNQESCVEFCEMLLLEIAKHRVGQRPDRVEPRAIKRRPKPQKLLQKPRKEAIAELLAI